MKRQRINLKHRLHGFVLLLILLTILVIGGVSVLALIASRSSSQARTAESAQRSAAVLNDAKAALLAYVIQRTDGGLGTRLGSLPTPDIVDATGNAIQYDGTTILPVPPLPGVNSSDLTHRCLSSATSTGFPAVLPGTMATSPNQRCLGKFPWRDLELNLGNADANDPLGYVPWLAISANLHHWDNCLKRVNSDLANWPAAGGTTCPSADNTLPYPWLTVVDATGAVLLDKNGAPQKIAAVLIAPGAPIQTFGRNQNRTPAAPGFPADYLDAIELPLGCSTACTVTFDNANLSNTFIQIPPGTHYPANAQNTKLAGTPIATFNDQLVYVTVDEIVEALEQRVLAEMKSSLLAFKDKVATPSGLMGMPAAAPFSTPINDSVNASSKGKLVGLFPFMSDRGTKVGLPTGQATDFAWKIDNFPSVAPECRKVDVTPTRWADLSRVEPTMLEGAGSGVGIWRGSKAILVSGTMTFTKTFLQWDTKADCEAGGSVGTRPPANYFVSREILLDIECGTTPNLSYYATSTVLLQTYAQNYRWACGSVNPIGASVKFVDTVTPPPSSGIIAPQASYTLKPGGNVELSNLRYQPIMPAWFFDNEWYKTAFYAVGRDALAQTSTDCGAATSLTVGMRTGIASVALLASKGLASPPAARPSMPPADYLEGLNATAASDCKFEDPSRAKSATFNDRIMVVSP